MSQHLNSLWLLPEAFLVLISSKLYVVTRGALVPEMARTDQFREHAAEVGEVGMASCTRRRRGGASPDSTHSSRSLGTLVGLLAGSVGAGLLKGIGAPSVLIAASIVFVGATVASLRLQRPAKVVREEVTALSQAERDRHALNPLGDVEVSWGLTRIGADALHGRFRHVPAGVRPATRARRTRLVRVCARAQRGRRPLRTRHRDPGEERRARVDIADARAARHRTRRRARVASTRRSSIRCCSRDGWEPCAAVAQPSFDAITQRHVPSGAQGRTFARFAVRQQLLWVVGAVIPVGITLGFAAGDGLLAGLDARLGSRLRRGAALRPSMKCIEGSRELCSA